MKKIFIIFMIFLLFSCTFPLGDNKVDRSLFFTKDMESVGTFYIPQFFLLDVRNNKDFVYLVWPLSLMEEGGQKMSLMKEHRDFTMSGVWYNGNFLSMFSSKLFTFGGREFNEKYQGIPKYYLDKNNFVINSSRNSYLEAHELYRKSIYKKFYPNFISIGNYNKPYYCGLNDLDSVSIRDLDYYLSPKANTNIKYSMMEDNLFNIPIFPHFNFSGESINKQQNYIFPIEDNSSSLLNFLCISMNSDEGIDSTDKDNYTISFKDSEYGLDITEGEYIIVNKINGLFEQDSKNIILAYAQDEYSLLDKSFYALVFNFRGGDDNAFSLVELSNDLTKVEKIAGPFLPEDLFEENYGKAFYEHLKNNINGYVDNCLKQLKEDAWFFSIEKINDDYLIHISLENENNNFINCSVYLDQDTLYTIILENEKGYVKTLVNLKSDDEDNRYNSYEDDYIGTAFLSFFNADGSSSFECVDYFFDKSENNFSSKSYILKSGNLKISGVFCDNRESLPNMTYFYSNLMGISTKHKFWTYQEFFVDEKCKVFVSEKFNKNIKVIDKK